MVFTRAGSTACSPSEHLLANDAPNMLTDSLINLIKKTHLFTEPNIIPGSIARSSTAHSRRPTEQQCLRTDVTVHAMHDTRKQTQEMQAARGDIELISHAVVTTSPAQDVQRTSEVNPEYQERAQTTCDGNSYEHQTYEEVCEQPKPLTDRNGMGYEHKASNAGNNVQQTFSAGHDDIVPAREVLPLVTSETASQTCSRDPAKLQTATQISLNAVEASTLHAYSEEKEPDKLTDEGWINCFDHTSIFNARALSPVYQDDFGKSAIQSSGPGKTLQSTTKVR